MSKKIELDLEHQQQIEKVHSNRREREEAHLQKNQKLNQKEAYLANAALERALQGQDIPQSSLEKIAIQLTKVLWVFAIFFDLWLSVKGHGASFFYPVSIFGFAIRPYLLLNLSTILVSVFAWRLKVGARYQEIMHSNFSAKPETSLATKMENKVWSLRIWNQLLSLLICIFTISEAVSLFGWEPALTEIGGFRFTLGFNMGMGTLFWIGMFKLFALKEK